MQLLRKEYCQQGTTVTAFAVLVLIITLCIVCTSAAPLNDSNIQGENVAVHKKLPKEDPLFENGLFEGDLKISKEMIINHYNFTSIPGGEELLHELTGNASTSTVNKRAAGSDIKLWSNNIVQYEISSGISKATATLIRQAMDHWEDNTCLRFQVVRHDWYVDTGPGGGIVAADLADYIEFVNTNDGCYSTSVGKEGRKQTINLQQNNAQGFGCEHFDIIVHEIGHAIGFWHEQSRPDRDRYITINWTNIKDGQASQFMKRNDFEIDYQASGYDYGSTMQYRNNAFAKDGCTGNECITMAINNNAEYIRQGRPMLGQRNGLSAEDIKQTKRLYACSGQGVQGFLMYRVIRGTSLPDTDPVLNNPDPYVKFTSVDSNGNKHYHQTSVKDGTTNPVWNEWIFLNELQWQFFRIRVWDDDNFLTFGDDAMSMSQTIVPEIGEHKNVQHCVDTACGGYVRFDYYFLQLVRAKLRIKVRSAHDLEDTDPWWNSPDPYVRIEAMQSTGSVQTKNSRVIGGTQNPTWNQWIDFGCQRWAFFHIQVWDDDGFLTGGDDEMSNKEMIILEQGLHESLRHIALGNGYLVYDYNLNVNDCN